MAIVSPTLTDPATAAVAMLCLLQSKPEPVAKSALRVAQQRVAVPVPKENTDGSHF